MDVKIWDIGNKTYIEKKDVQHIYVSCFNEYFKLDNTEYKTSEYDLQFIHEGD